MRRSGHRGKIGGDAHRGRAEHAYFAVRPWLLRNPLYGVVAVFHIAGEGGVFAFGFEFAADVLNDAGVAVLQVLLLRGGAVHEVFAIGGAGKDYGPGAVAGREINAGGEMDAVAHGDHFLFAGWSGRRGCGLGE